MIHRIIMITSLHQLLQLQGLRGFIHMHGPHLPVRKAQKTCGRQCRHEERQRPHQFARALDILHEECGPDRLVTFDRAVTTPEETIRTVTLAEATPDMADMRTVVLVGNAATRRVGRWVYTPRSMP